MIKRLLPIALTLMLASGAALAADSPGVFDQMDTNGDNTISKQEFHNYYEDSGVFDYWDANDDGWIGEDEFADGLYNYYDDDGDGYIDDAEWDDGVMVDDAGDNGFWDF